MEKNKQKMYYSLFKDSEIEYALDDDGNKIIDGYYSDGYPIYREIGTKNSFYDTPVQFKAIIRGKLNEMHAKEYGVDQSSVYMEICCLKGYLPLEYGSRIWKDSPIQWEDELNQIPDENSADYIVVGSLKEALNYDFFLLRRNNVK